MILQHLQYGEYYYCQHMFRFQPFNGQHEQSPGTIMILWQCPKIRRLLYMYTYAIKSTAAISLILDLRCKAIAALFFIPYGHPI